MREYINARADYDIAIDLEADEAETWNNRGETWAIDCEWDRAIVDFTEAIRLAPDYALAKRNLAAAKQRCQKSE